jgi:hypothetical protein
MIIVAANAVFELQGTGDMHFNYLCRCCFLCAMMLLLSSCSSTIKQYYSDAFYPEDKIYENKTIGFLMTFRGKWNIITNPNDMNRHYKSFAQTMQKAGGELLFMGSTVEELYGVKALALNLNESPGDYAQYIRALNKTEIDTDTTPIDFYTENLHAVKWIYTKAGYRFIEFFFVVDTYNVRLSFWTKPELFTNFLPVFEEIVGTITFTSGF